MTLEKLKVPYECRRVFPLEGDHKKPEFLKLNPQHTIPVYKDGDFVLNESRAILAYLATVHDDDKLYPKDPKVRAKVDCRLYFDMGLFNKIVPIIVRKKLSRLFGRHRKCNALKNPIPILPCRAVCFRGTSPLRTSWKA